MAKRPLWKMRRLKVNPSVALLHPSSTQSQFPSYVAEVKIMAKRGTLDHQKTFELATALGIPECYALGVLDGLWEWTAKYRPHGDLAGVSPAFVARAIHYPGDGEQLFQILIKVRYLDKLSSGQLLIHDWPEHAENSVHKYLKDHGEVFADGTPPYNRYKNRPRADDADSQSDPAPVTTTASRSHDEVTSESCLPLPLPLASANANAKERGANAPSSANAASLSSSDSVQKQKPPGRSDPSPEEFVGVYEEELGNLRACSGLTVEREKKLKQRIRDGQKHGKFTLERFRDAVRKMAREAVEPDPPWYCAKDFDWLIANDTNIEIVLEGSGKKPARRLGNLDERFIQNAQPPPAVSQHPRNYRHLVPPPDEKG